VTETLLDVLEVVRCAASLASARHCLVREVMPFTLSVCAYTVSRPCHSDNTATLRRSHTHNVDQVSSLFRRHCSQHFYKGVRRGTRRWKDRRSRARRRRPSPVWGSGASWPDRKFSKTQRWNCTYTFP